MPIDTLIIIVIWGVIAVTTFVLKRKGLIRENGGWTDADLPDLTWEQQPAQAAREAAAQRAEQQLHAADQGAGQSADVSARMQPQRPDADATGPAAGTADADAPQVIGRRLQQRVAIRGKRALRDAVMTREILDRPRAYDI